MGGGEGSPLSVSDVNLSFQSAPTRNSLVNLTVIGENFDISIHFHLLNTQRLLEEINNE